MKRKEQYERKFNFILENIHDLPKNPEQNKYYMEALFYRLQVSIEAAMDLIAMFCKDIGVKVEDDYTNIEELEKLNFFDPSLLNELRRLNGLRNIIVHKYNKIETELIIQQKNTIKATLDNFVKILSELIHDKL